MFAMPCQQHDITLLKEAFETFPKQPLTNNENELLHYPTLF